MPCWRQAGEDSQSRKGASYTKLQADFLANQDSLGFWTVDIHLEGRSQRSAPQKRHVTPEEARLLYTRKTERQGWGRQ